MEYHVETIPTSYILNGFLSKDGIKIISRHLYFFSHPYIAFYLFIYIFGNQNKSHIKERNVELYGDVI